MSDKASLEQAAREALERARKATEGPWLSRDHGGRRMVRASKEFEGGFRWAIANCSDAPVGERRQDNAEFIAHARTDVPELARGVLELTEERERLREVAKASRRVLLADAAGRKPDVWEWKRLADALEALSREPGEERNA